MFEEGKLYRLALSDGASYMVVGPEQANGGRKAVKIDVGQGTPTAACTTTTNLNRSRWEEITEAGLPPRLLAKLKDKASRHLA